MKRDKDPFFKHWVKAGGYGGKEENRGKKISGLKIIVLLGIIISLAWGYSFFFVKSVPETEGVTKVEEPAPSPPPEEEKNRKNIYDRNLRALAISFKVESIYVKPLEFDDIEKTVSSLAGALELDEKNVLDELKAQRSFKWVVKNISPEKARSVEALKLPGVYFYEQEQRFYPNRANTAHIVGEVKDGRGLSGVELLYDDILLSNAGQPGAAENGGREIGLVLTLDSKMQMLMEQEMTEMLKEISAHESASENITGVSALLVDASAGEILAYSKLPSFAVTDLHAASSAGGEDRLLSGQLDPGLLSQLYRVAAFYEQGLPVMAGADVLPEYIKLLAPRLTKKARGGSGKFPVVQVKDGSYVSDWLVSALLEQQWATEKNINEPFDITGIKETFGQCTVDLPGENGGKDTGLGMLCGFASLVNGGKMITPHFLKSTLSEAGEQKEWQWPAQDNKVIGSDASRGLVFVLRKGAQATNGPFVLELLQPQKDLPADAGMETAPVEATAATGNKTEKPEIKADSAFVARGDALALAAVPASKPELVLLIMVDDGHFDMNKPSPVKHHAESLLQAALPLYHQKDGGKQQAESLSREEIFQRWRLKNNLGPDWAAVRKEDGDKMINVRGMSLRKALQELQRYNVKVVVEGSGVVKMQHPAAGSKVPDGTLVVLKAEAKQ
ncbi:MAG: PASTA domain-containing protein [Deltaproteobacteria bacterium]|nr:PASTA domain-containing protein [Deltaproteobacteria bacterium]